MKKLITTLLTVLLLFGNALLFSGSILFAETDKIEVTLPDGEKDSDNVYWFSYTGSEITPTVKVELVKDGGSREELASGTDYTVTYSSNNKQITVPWNQAKVTITGTSAKFTNIQASIDVPFEIKATGSSVTFTAADQTYDGSAKSLFGTTPLDINLDGGTIKYAVVPAKQSSGADTTRSDIQEADWKLNADDTKKTDSNTYSVWYIATKSVSGGGTSGKDYNQYEKIGEAKIIPEKIVDESNSSVTLSPGSFTYTGTEQKPTVSIKETERDVDLIEGTDFEVAFTDKDGGTDLTNAGTKNISITYKGNYTGTETKTYTINQYPISGCTVNGVNASYKYNGSQIKPTITSVVDGNSPANTLDANDYEVTYGDNINAATNGGSITITAKENTNYTGSKTINFDISKLNLQTDGLTITGIDSEYVYTGSEQKPAVTALNDTNGNTIPSTDYVVTYKDAADGTDLTNVGTKTVVVTATTDNPNVEGSTSTTYAITPYDIKDCTLTGIETSYTYTGSAIEPTTEVLTYGTNTLVKDNGVDPKEDYSISYGANLNAADNGGSITYTAVGINYKGTKTVNFDITPKALVDGDITLNELEYTYTGSPIEADITVKDGTTPLVENTDYTLTYANDGNQIDSTSHKNVSDGTITVTITGIGNYSGTFTRTFTITAKALNNDCLGTTPIDDQTYTGQEIKPSITVTDNTTTLVAGSDYDVAYKASDDTLDITNVGNKKVVVTLKGNYSGTATKAYKIVAATLVDSDIVFAEPSKVYTYDGTAKTPIFSVVHGGNTLTSGSDKDYTFEFTNNTNAGTATLTVTAVSGGNYTGTASKEFTINRKALKENEVTLPTDTFTYRGAAIQPSVLVKDGAKTLVVAEDPLNPSKLNDYTVEYENNSTTNGGQPKVIVKGQNNYTGTVEKNFTITKALSSDIDVSLSQDEFEYNGQEHKPTLTVKFKEGDVTVDPSEYQLSYENNINVSTDDNKAKVIIKFIDTANFNANGSFEFTINPKTITCKVTVTTNPDDIVYLGKDKPVIPSIKVTYGDPEVVLTPSDYDVIYENNTVSGTATVKVTPKGNYTGDEVSKNFTINPKNIADSDVIYLMDTTHKYINNPVEPKPDIYYGGIKLTEGTDYETIVPGNYADNIAKSTLGAKLTITGKGNFSGTKDLMFSIVDDPIVVSQKNNGNIVIKSTNKATLDAVAEDNINAKIIVTFPGTDNTVTVTNYGKSVNLPIKVEGNDTDGYYIELAYTSEVKAKNREVVKGSNGGYATSVAPKFTVTLKGSSVDVTSDAVYTTRGQETIDIKEELLAFDQTFNAGVTTIYVNGVPQTSTEVVLDDYRDVIVQTFVYNNNKQGSPADIDSKRYTSFKTYLLTQDAYSVGGWAEVEHLDELDSVMKFAGAQVRLWNPTGVRFLTQITKDNFAKLTSISAGLGNNATSANDDDIKYNIIQFGTILAWTDTSEGKNGIGATGEPALNANLTKDEYGTYVGLANNVPIYAYDKNIYTRNWVYESNATDYTFSNYMKEYYIDGDPTKPSWAGRYNENVATRAYMVLRPVDAVDDSQDVTIYGGTVYRSINHVAQSIIDSGAYAVGSTEYNIVSNLIQQPE